VPGDPHGLLPQPGERGLASAEPADVAALLAPAWAAVLDLASVVDLDAPTRLPGWSTRDVLVHLGSWDGESWQQAALRAGRTGSPDDPDADAVRRRAEHHDAGREEIREALVAARDRALGFLTGPEVETLGRQWVDSVAGELPVTGLVVAQAYELAVHALDLAPGGAPEPDPALLDAGVAAVVDVTGALAARRGMSATFAVSTPAGRWATGAREGSWTTLRVGPDLPVRDLPWPGVAGEASVVLDAVSGRALAAQLVLTRRLRLHDVPGLLRLLPALEAAPGLPGGSAVRATARALEQTGRLAGRLGGRLGGALTRR